MENTRKISFVDAQELRNEINFHYLELARQLPFLDESNPRRANVLAECHAYKVVLDILNKMLKEE